MNAITIGRAGARKGRLAALAAMTTILLSTSPLAGAVEAVDETHAMSPDGLVRVENVAGEISVETWDKAEAHVEVDPADDVESIEVTPTDGGIRVIVRTKENARRIRDTQVDLRVPRGASLELWAVSADIRVEGSAGQRIDLETVSGDILVEAEVQQARLKTVSGDLEFEGASNRTAAETVSGDVELSGLTGEVHVNSVSGDADVRAYSVDRCRAETVSGDLLLQMSLNDGGLLQAKAMSGDVQIDLPAGQQAEFSAQTFSGDISSDVGAVSRSGTGGGTVLRHSEGSNDARVTAETFSGDININTD